MFHVVLHQPQIPPNTGNMIRLCANTGCSLHLVRPIGFGLDRKALKRAELDYGDLAQVQVHATWEDCVASLAGVRMYAVETGGEVCYTQASFAPGDAVLFGSEHRGLPAGVLARVPPARRLHIPMQPANRSLNLANAVALVVYEAWRQNGFAGAATPLPPASAGS